MTSEKKRAHALMLVTSLLISTSFPVVEIVAPTVPARLLTLLRFTMASLLFVPWIVRCFGRAALPDARALARYALLSATLVLFFWAMFAALRSTTAINTGALFTCGPLFAAAWSTLLLRRWPSRRHVTALLVGMLGALWVVFRGDPRAALALQLLPGDPIFLAGTASLGLYVTLVKRLHRGEPMAVMTFWTLVTGTVWLALINAPSLELAALAAIPRATLGWLLYLSFFTTLVTFYLTQLAATIIGPAPALAYTYLNPTLVLLIELVRPSRRGGHGGLSLLSLPGALLSCVALLMQLGEGADARESSGP